MTFGKIPFPDEPKRASVRVVFDDGTALEAVGIVKESRLHQPPWPSSPINFRPMARYILELVQDSDQWCILFAPPQEETQPVITAVLRTPCVEPPLARVTVDLTPEAAAVIVSLFGRIGTNGTTHGREVSEVYSAIRGAYSRDVRFDVLVDKVFKTYVGRANHPSLIGEFTK